MVKDISCTYSIQLLNISGFQLSTALLLESGLQMKQNYEYKLSQQKQPLLPCRVSNLYTGRSSLLSHKYLTKQKSPLCHNMKHKGQVSFQPMELIWKYSPCFTSKLYIKIYRLLNITMGLDIIAFTTRQ